MRSAIVIARRPCASTNATRCRSVIVVTSSDAESDIVRSYTAGASCYVTKPLDLATFQTVVRAIEAFWFTVAKLP